MFVDSHVHLADPAFASDADAVIDRARGAGARALICIGESPDAAERAGVLAASRPGFLFHTAGVHPHDAAQFDAARDLPRVRAQLGAGAVAVGECGLDYHYDNSPRETQRHVFAEQLALAAEMHRPVVVHTRDAADDTAAMIRDAGTAGVCGVLHCFTGPASLAVAAIDNGWYISFSGVVTFRKWTDDELIRMIPADRLLVESDAPYLAPVPHRGKRNEPAFVAATVAKLASVLGVSESRLGADTVRNTERLFGLAIAPDPV